MSKVIGLGFNPEQKPFLSQVASGILEFGRSHPEYRYVITHPEREHTEISGHMDLYRGMDGVITGMARNAEDQLTCTNFPVIYVGPEALRLPVHWVGPDYHQVADQAMQFFLDKHFHSLAYFHNGDSVRFDSQLLMDQCIKFTRNCDLRFAVFYEGKRVKRAGSWQLGLQLEDLAEFLSELPPLTGLFAPDDEHAWRVVRAAEMAGLSIPDQLSVLGVFSSPFISEFTTPSLSHLFLDYKKIGYRAAECMDRLLQEGEPDSPLRVTVPTLGITERASTAFAATEDPVILKSMAYMMKHLRENPSLDDIAQASHVSRSTLFRHFQEVLGRKPGEVFRSYRLQQAQKMLLGTNKPPAEIALECGFSDQAHFTNAIKKATGHSPGKFRDGLRLH